MNLTDQLTAVLWRAGFDVEPPSLAAAFQVERYALDPRHWTAGHAKAHPRAGTGKWRRKTGSGQMPLFREEDHPRGQPENQGQFVEKGQQAAPAQSQQTQQPPQEDAGKLAPAGENYPAGGRIRPMPYKQNPSGQYRPTQDGTPEYTAYYYGPTSGGISEQAHHFISDWQDSPISCPTDSIIKEFGKYVPSKTVTLYRGGKTRTAGGYKSWTYVREVAEEFVEPGEKVMKRTFYPDEILLDFTKLPAEYSKALEETGMGNQLGEVIVAGGEFAKHMKQVRAQPPAKPSPTETPEFTKWFAGSKIVDKAGKPMVVYHSTPDEAFDEFKLNPNDVGIHFGPEEAANANLHRWRREADTGSTFTPHIYPVYLSIQNPLRMQDAGSWDEQNMADEFKTKFPKDSAVIDTFESPHDVRTYLQSKGYDGIVYANFEELDDLPSEEEIEAGVSAPDSYIAFSPTQIKSATANLGTFDPKNPKIRHSLATALQDEMDRRVVRYKGAGFLSQFVSGFKQGLGNIQWEESKHPRGGKGTQKGGKFVSKGQGGGGAAKGKQPAAPKATVPQQPAGSYQTVTVDGQRYDVAQKGKDWFARAGGDKKAQWQKVNPKSVSRITDELSRQQFEQQERVRTQAKRRLAGHGKYILDAIQAGPKNGHALWKAMGIPKDDFLDAYFALADAGKISQDQDTGALSLIASPPRARKPAPPPQMKVSPITGIPPGSVKRTPEQEKILAAQRAGPTKIVSTRTPEQQKAIDDAKEKTKNELAEKLKVQKAEHAAEAVETANIKRTTTISQANKMAREVGVDLRTFMSEARTILATRHETWEGREAAKKEGRKLLHLNKATMVSKEDRIPGLDEIAPRIARQYPGIIGNYADHQSGDWSPTEGEGVNRKAINLEQNLLDLIAEGATPEPTLYDEDIVQDTADYIRTQKGSREAGEDEGELVGAGDLADVPFAKPGRPQRYSLAAAFRAEYARRNHEATVQRYALLFREYYAKRHAFVWTEEDEAKHPRDEEGQWAEKDSAGRMGGMEPEKSPNTPVPEWKSQLATARAKMNEWYEGNPMPHMQFALEPPLPPGTPNRKQPERELRARAHAPMAEWQTR